MYIGADVDIPYGDRKCDGVIVFCKREKSDRALWLNNLDGEGNIITGRMPTDPAVLQPKKLQSTDKVDDVPKTKSTAPIPKDKVKKKRPATKQSDKKKRPAATKENDTPAAMKTVKKKRHATKQSDQNVEKSTKSKKKPNSSTKTKKKGQNAKDKVPTKKTLQQRQVNDYQMSLAVRSAKDLTSDDEGEPMDDDVVEEERTDGGLAPIDAGDDIFARREISYHDDEWDVTDAHAVTDKGDDPNRRLEKLEKSLDEVRCIATDAKTTASEASFKAEESARKLSVWEGHWNKRSEEQTNLYNAMMSLIHQQQTPQQHMQPQQMQHQQTQQQQPMRQQQTQQQPQHQIERRQQQPQQVIQVQQQPPQQEHPVSAIPQHQQQQQCLPPSQALPITSVSNLISVANLKYAFEIADNPRRATKLLLKRIFGGDLHKFTYKGTPEWPPLDQTLTAAIITEITARWPVHELYVATTMKTPGAAVGRFIGNMCRDARKVERARLQRAFNNGAQ